MTMTLCTKRTRAMLLLLVAGIITSVSFSQVSAFSSSTQPLFRSSAIRRCPSHHIREISSSNNGHSFVVLAQSQENEGRESISLTSPLNDPALVTLDVVASLGFAAIGKASHAPDGSIDLGAVLVTAFPFLAAWIGTSPFTGVYQDLEEEGIVADSKASLAKEAAIQTAKGWALAVPLGCCLRGIIKGYVPPLPFVIVTLVATLVILGTVRVVYALATTTTLDK